MRAALLSCVFVCGCSTTRPHGPPADHPAHPGAPASPTAAHSTTLAIEPDAPAHADNGGPAPAGGPAHAPSAPAPAAYVCPMHPDVTSDKPDQRCPKCGMRLVKKTGGAP